MLPSETNSEPVMFQEPTSPINRKSSPSSSRPRPSFLDEATTFSTKKERRVPLSRPPPRPQVKCASVSRIFHQRKLPLLKAQNVTFRDSAVSDSLVESPLVNTAVYDSAKKVSYFKQAFIVESKIGAGCFGNVFKVRSRDNGELFAVKIARERYRGVSDRKEKLEEVRKHEFLPPHTNCVRFYKSWEEKGRLYQQFELCRNSLGELSDEKHDLPEKLIWAYLVDLLMAVEHLHDHNLIHMDIKPENIFIGMDGICKLGDFGLVIDLAKADTNFVEGDPRYLAAEVLHERKFTKAADIFALGASILELATDLDLPKQGALWHELRQAGPDPKMTSHLSPDLRRIIQLMMANDYKQRPSAKQLLALPSVQLATKKRLRQLYFGSWVRSTTSFIMPFWLMVSSLLTLVAKPFQAFFKGFRRLVWHDSRQSTPTQIKSPSEEPTKLTTTSSWFGLLTSTAKKKTEADEAVNRMSSNGLILFSDEEDDADDPDEDSSSGRSVLASMIHYSDVDSDREDAKLDAKSRERKFPDFDSADAFVVYPTPLKARRRPLNDLVKTTPGGLFRRSSRIANNSPTATPKKKLDFELDELELDDTPSFSQVAANFEPNSSFGFSASFHDNEEDEPNLFPVRPKNLSTRFDCFSDTDEDDLPT